MYKIVRKELLAPDTHLLEVEAPRIAEASLPGQFVIVKADETAERIPLTVGDTDLSKGTVTLVVKDVGFSTHKICGYVAGSCLRNIAGPLGRPSEFTNYSDEELHSKKFCFIAGGVGIAPIYPLVRWMRAHGVDADVIVGARTRSLLFYMDKLRSAAGHVYVATDDASAGMKGVVTDLLDHLVRHEGKRYDEVTAIGPMVMMRFCAEKCRELGIKCTVSLNSLMVDGTGMCGACRVTVGGKTKFTCVDGPEFDASELDFAECMRRQAMYDHVEGRKLMEEEERAEGHVCRIGGITGERPKPTARVQVREQPAQQRIHNFREVCYGYNAEEAVEEARRCLNCRKPMCVTGCPVQIDIPAFVHEIACGQFEKAARIMHRDTALPAVCGRVCPQETQCEGKCVLNRKGQPVAIGKLERFVGDWMLENDIAFAGPAGPNGHKVAVVGSGPAGLTCAKQLCMKGYDITVFEALHEFGGVLVYGIPAFRLPKENVVKKEIDNLEKLGVRFQSDVIVGRTVSVDDLIEKHGYEAVFVGTGAGSANLLDIPGENCCGVVTANEFLTRNNLLSAYKKGYETPNFVGRRVAVVGGGNVAMDSARTAVRLGADVHVVYRRSEEELPARKEEVDHAKEEGVKFDLLCCPTAVLGDDKGWVKGMTCVRMELGAPDASGRCRPIPIPGSEFNLDVDMVIIAVGTSPNPLIADTTQGLDVTPKGCISADSRGQTSRRRVFAGGDAVSGSATVILAMGAGKQAAEAIDEFIQQQPRPERKILITGGAGFIGSHVVRRFVTRYPQYEIFNLDKLTYAGNLENLRDIERRPNYHFIKGDIEDAVFVDALFRQHRFDGVIHLAAESHVDRSIADPMQFIRTNVLGTVNLLNAARAVWEGDTEGKLFYQISTDEVYGALGPSGSFTEATAYNPHSPYSAAKASADHFVRAYHDTYGLPTVISNCSNNYGPNQFPEKLIPLCIHNIRHNKPLPVYGKGVNVRDWLYVEDHAKAIDMIFHKARPGATYNIGGNNEWRNIDLIRKLIEIMDRKSGRPAGASLPLITFVADRAGHDLRYAIDAFKIKKEIGWEPDVKFDEGFEKTVDWYLENSEWLENVTSGAYADYYEKMYGNRQMKH